MGEERRKAIHGRKGGIVVRLRTGLPARVGVTILEATAFGVPMIVPEAVVSVSDLLSEAVEVSFVYSRRQRVRRRVPRLHQTTALGRPVLNVPRAPASQFSSAHFADEIGAAIESLQTA